jgi:hypothetical protein
MEPHGTVNLITGASLYDCSREVKEVDSSTLHKKIIKMEQITKL